MTSEVDYYNVLQSAVARTQADSFEARGAVYDRLWQIVLDQLHSNHDISEEDVVVERAAFLRAVQRIEFGGGAPAVEEDDRQAGPHEQAVPRNVEKTARVRLKPRRRVFSRIVLGMISGCLVLLVAGMAYALITIRMDSAAAARWADESEGNSLQSHVLRIVIAINNLIDGRSSTTTPTATTTTTPIGAAQRAVLYEESQASATGTTFSGRAVWRHQSKSKDPATAVLSIEVEIPQKDLFLEVSVRRAPTGGAISHFVEFRFLGGNRSSSDAVENVLGILMKNDELSRGIDLKGQIVRVQPGVFLMGLSGTEADLAQNMKLLKDRPWLDIPIVFKGGVRSLLAIEKGAMGENALNQAFEAWGQG